MKVLARNKRASFDYSLDRKLLLGMVLNGAEAKSARRGDVSLSGSFVTIRGRELWLVNCHIGPYGPAAGQQTNYQPTVSRKLLARKSEVDKLVADTQSGRHLVPTALGLAGRYVKLELGVGQSRKRHDKRRTISRREAARDMARAIKTKSTRPNQVAKKGPQ